MHSVSISQHQYHQFFSLLKEKESFVIISDFPPLFPFHRSPTTVYNWTIGSTHNTWNKYIRKFCSSTSISSGDRFCCFNFWAPCMGSKREYSCCKHKLRAMMRAREKNQITNIALKTLSVGPKKQDNTIRSSNCRRYQARIVYSALLQSFKNSARSVLCSEECWKTQGPVSINRSSTLGKKQANELLHYTKQLIKGKYW